MPGHVKAAKSGEKDPDPEPYLVVSPEMRRDDMMREYNSKKSYWCPDAKGGFMECMLDSRTDTEATVYCGHIVSDRLLVTQV